MYRCMHGCVMWDTHHFSLSFVGNAQEHCVVQCAIIMKIFYSILFYSILFCSFLFVVFRLVNASHLICMKWLSVWAWGHGNRFIFANWIITDLGIVLRSFHWSEAEKFTIKIFRSQSRFSKQMQFISAYSCSLYIIFIQLTQHFICIGKISLNSYIVIFQ